MRLTEIRINLCDARASRLKAFVSLTFDNTFVIRDVKLIDGNDGLFLAMPSRKLSDHCPSCSEKNHLRARFCNNCGQRLDPDRAQHQQRNGNAIQQRVKLHADIAHPINADSRIRLEQEVRGAYLRELDRSRQPGYVKPNLDCEDYDLYDMHPARSFDRAAPPAGEHVSRLSQLRPVG